MPKNRIKELRVARGWSQEDLAQAAGTTNQQIGRLEKSARSLTVEWMERLAAPLGVQPQDLIYVPSEVPVTGFLEAGGRVRFLANDEPRVFAPIAPGVSMKTIAIQILSSSLGPTFNRWYVYFDDDRHPPTPEMIGELCVVGLPDGSVLVRRLHNGSLPGRYHLLSDTEGMIENVDIAWASIVVALAPRR